MPYMQWISFRGDVDVSASTIILDSSDYKCQLFERNYKTFHKLVPLNQAHTYAMAG